MSKPPIAANTPYQELRQMAVRIEIEPTILKNALEKELASQKRLANTTKQKAFVPIIEKDIAELQKGLGSITETK